MASEPDKETALSLSKNVKKIIEPELKSIREDVGHAKRLKRRVNGLTEHVEVIERDAAIQKTQISLLFDELHKLKATKKD